MNVTTPPAKTASADDRSPPPTTAANVEILAPAGGRESFLAALAAGADAVYCGLKRYSARMAAQNFTLEELVGLTRLAHERGTRVYVALNVLLRPGELDDTGQVIERLARQVRPDGLIVQDTAAVALARQVGFGGEVHLSTLANVSFPAALDLVRRDLKVDRVVIPRELSIDEIRAMAAACPDGLRLEVFVHGALCYAVSGRCYWSSFLGGRSGLRGRCVQPCRRRYRQGDRSERFFSCQDLSLDVLVKVLKTIGQVAAWKIEGRKKGPHYVYYTTTAYRLLRDQGHDPQAKRDALSLLERALGRPGTHYRFLPQRPQQPMAEGEAGASGLLVGRLRGGRQAAYLSPREPLMTGDLLRIGYEDDPWHAVVRVGKTVPKAGRFSLKPTRGKTPPRDVPVFLIDRREPALAQQLVDLEARLEPVDLPPASDKSPFGYRRPRPKRIDLPVTRTTVGRLPRIGHDGVWLSEAALAATRRDPGPWWWLPPVVWPSDAAQVTGWVQTALALGARGFVLNAPWQRALFADRVKVPLWAGPFCNLANPLAINTAARLGLAGVVVSPELGADDLLALPAQSPLPLGIVVAGHWPLCVARNLPGRLQAQTAFASPRNEAAWAVAHGPDVWIYPNWTLDLTAHETVLTRAGYRLLVQLDEPVPAGVAVKPRPGLWNWNLTLR